MLPRYDIELKGMIKRYGGIDLLAQFFAVDKPSTKTQGQGREG
jgi:hypothetical protein